jgi:alkanesulfonate monooxygenase SsuD/methylene tetrahydromethanopterin reductase-like flavin-dependent oxidoreductase (luciferase family)
MGELVDDDVLSTFAVVAEPEQVAGRVKARYADLVDRILFSPSVRDDPDRWRAAIAEFHA